MKSYKILNRGSVSPGRLASFAADNLMLLLRLEGQVTSWKKFPPL